MFAPKLKPGDTIGLASPSHIADREGYGHVIRVLEARGFAVKTGANIYKDTYGYSATPQERADDINALFADDEVKMVLFGGGDGGNELLPYLDFDIIRTHPKLTCSYSDGTTLLNVIYTQTGLVTYYGQTPGIFDDLRYYDYMQFSQHFLQDGKQDNMFVPNSQWHTLHGGACDGLLIGGYTVMFALLLGNRYFPYDDTKQYILFLEDHEQFNGLAAVSSLVSHIEQSAFMGRVTGLLFGHYNTTHPPELFDRLARLGAAHNIPVIYCDDFGHGVNHAILPIGQQARLDADAQTLVFI